MNKGRVAANEALERLRDGNARFVDGDRCIDTYLSHTRIDEHIGGQAPFAVVLGCSDSRVPVEIIFDVGLGDLFVVRVAGNIVAPSLVGSIELAEPGDLPPAVMDLPLLQFSHLGHDPLEQQFQDDSTAGATPAVVTDTDAALGPIGAELALPKAVDVGLRSLGVDPGTMTAPELVLGMLKLYGYAVTDVNDTTKHATKGGQTTFVRLVPHQEGGYAELDESAIRQFVADFAEARLDRGLVVTDKYGPFEVYERERRDPRVRFVTRERLQKFVDSLALS